MFIFIIMVTQKNFYFLLNYKKKVKFWLKFDLILFLYNFYNLIFIYNLKNNETFNPLICFIFK